jgi:hypothetical protein
MSLLYYLAMKFSTTKKIQKCIKDELSIVAYCCKQKEKKERKRKKEQ